MAILHFINSKSKQTSKGMLFVLRYTMQDTEMDGTLKHANVGRRNGARADRGKAAWMRFYSSERTNLRRRRILGGDTESSSIPISMKLSVRSVSAASSPHIPIHFPSEWAHFAA